VKVMGYGRMSTDKQQLSPKVQTDKITAWFQAQQASGLLPPDAEFGGVVIDEAVSSRIDMLKRPAGHGLLVDLEPGDSIVVASLTRAFRSASDAERTMAVLEEAGIGMVFLDMQLDTSTPYGKVVLSILASCAKLERDMISERTSDALEAKRRRGLPTRRASPGWKITYSSSVPRGERKKYSKYTPDMDERFVATACRQLLRDGYTRHETYLAIRGSMRSRKVSKRYSERNCVNLAVACCLDFPKVSLSHASRLVGFRVDSMDFVRRKDHKEIIKLINNKLQSEGYAL